MAQGHGRAMVLMMLLDQGLGVGRDEASGVHEGFYAMRRSPRLRKLYMMVGEKLFLGSNALILTTC